ncbi:MAG: acyl-ACP--UDP-N-acetylglucosamine O-acyltransferase [Phycisphaerales bacterium]|nr:acyl-ACP--UDP-N-acetylglucosamine O-acyltransferase [Phycisphaerales bacterium]
MSSIHPMAVIDPTAEIGRDVTIGPFCHVGAGVRLGDGCLLHTNVTLLGPATIGPRNTFFPCTTIGTAPQDLKYKGGPTSVAIGSDNIFRENVTIHRGTEVDRVSGGVTRIGDHNLLMVGVHIAHDCDIGSNCIIANQVQLAGHVKIEDCVNVGGASAMHHFVTIGRNAFVGGMTRVTHDVPPYVKVQGYDQEVRGLNLAGVQRWQLPEASISALKTAVRLLFVRRGDNAPGRTVEGIREIEANGLIADEHVRTLVEFLKRKLEIGIYGRVREHFRQDSDADRESFYRAAGTDGAV